MCIAIDANRIGDFCNTDNEDMGPVREWMRNGKKNKIAYSPYPKIKEELKGNNKFKKIFKEWDSANKIKKISITEVESRFNELDKNSLRSNDLHILALAKAANVKLLVTLDKKLMEDFKRICGGSIYSRKEHSSLLQKVRCP